MADKTESKESAFSHVPLSLSAQTFSIISSMIEEGSDITPLLLNQFNEAKLQVASEVDHVITLESMLSGTIARAKENEKTWADVRKRYEKVQERLKNHLKEIIELNPDIPFAGKLGRLAIQASDAKLEVDFDESKFDENVITENDIHYKYYTMKYVLIKDVIKADLKAGWKLPWARLVKTNHLRIRK